MIYQSQDGNVFVRMHPGDVLPEALQKVAVETDLGSAVIQSGVGMLRDVVLSFFAGEGRYESREYPEPMELVSLSGNITHQDDGYFVHAHAALAGPDHKLVGGHLTRGVVAVTNEIVLARLPIRAVRKLEPESGLRGISFPDAKTK
jgi:predicted DNA-binding protein with PD1-like motif